MAKATREHELATSFEGRGKEGDFFPLHPHIGPRRQGSGNMQGMLTGSKYVPFPDRSGGQKTMSPVGLLQSGPPPVGKDGECCENGPRCSGRWCSRGT